MIVVFEGHDGVGKTKILIRSQQYFEIKGMLYPLYTILTLYFNRYVTR